MEKAINQLIKSYQNSLNEEGIKVKKIMLYGSYANSQPQEDSDIDLLVISEDFARMDLWERLTLLGRAGAKLRKPIEAWGVTQAEFASQEKGSFIGDEIKAKGIEIK